MRFIFNCKPDDFILAGRSIKSVIKENPDSPYTIIQFENGSVFGVKRIKSGYSVWSNNYKR